MLCVYKWTPLIDVQSPELRLLSVVYYLDFITAVWDIIALHFRKYVLWWLCLHLNEYWLCVHLLLLLLYIAIWIPYYNIFLYSVDWTTLLSVDRVYTLFNLTACGSSCRKQCIPLLLHPLSRRYFFNLCQFQISIKLIIDNQNSIIWWCHCYVLSGIILIVRWISTVERRLLNFWFYMAFRCNFLHVYFDNRAT